MVRSPTILVVDDDDAFRRMLCTALRHTGCTVDEMDGGAAAQDYLTSTNADLVISDIDMIEVDGLALLEWWRARGGTTPFVFVTAMSIELEHVRARAERLGAVAVLEKPFDFETLHTIIRDLFG